jgi:chromosome segregation ATPase
LSKVALIGEPAILLHSMNQQQVEQLIDERVGENIARSFGVIQEWFSDQFKTMNEKIDFYQEKNERNFSIIFDEIATIKERVTEISLDIEILKKDVSMLKNDVLILKKDVAMLKQDVAMLKEDVAMLKKDVSILKEDVTVLKQDVASIKKDIKKLDYRVGRLEKHYEYA